MKFEKKLKQFNIDIEDIKPNDELEKYIKESINKMYEYDLSGRFEVVLNNNLIEVLDKYTRYRSILGCRISYDYLDKNISFVVRSDEKPSYEYLEQENQQLKRKIKNIEEAYETEAEAKYYEYIDNHRSELQQRIDKAIGIIKSELYHIKDKEHLISAILHLENILKGDNNE